MEQCLSRIRLVREAHFLCYQRGIHSVLIADQIVEYERIPEKVYVGGVKILQLLGWPKHRFRNLKKLTGIPTLLRFV